MSGWAELLESEFLESPLGSTTKTPKTYNSEVSPVSPVCFKGMENKKMGVSPVSPVRSRDTFKKHAFLDDDQKELKTDQPPDLEKHDLSNIETSPQTLANPNTPNPENPQNAGLGLARPQCSNLSRPEQQLRARVMDAAMKVCQYWGDDEEAIQEMRQGIEALPSDQLRHTLNHFEEAYKGLIRSDECIDPPEAETSSTKPFKNWRHHTPNPKVWGRR